MAQQEIVIDKMFSKGFLDDLGKNKTPDYFLDSCLNIRIKNGGVTVRNGQQEAYDAGAANPIRGINTNTSISSTRVYYCANSALRYLDTSVSPNTSTSIGSISTDNKVRFLNSGKYMILLTGASYPWYYDGTSLTQVTSGTLTASVNPQFGAVFAGATFINSQLNPNIMYVSRPITLANPAYCVDWLGTGAQTINVQSKLIALVSTMNSLWVFTQENIQRLDRNNLDTTGGIASLYTIPFTQTYSPPANADCVTTAGQTIFFLTANKKIATINYKGSVTEPQMAIISDTPGASIDGWMQREMNDDMSANWVEYDPTRNLVKFHVRRTDSLVPDTVLIYDIQNQTFLLDDNKYTANSTRLGDTIYAGNALAHQIVIDEIGEDDLGDPIYRECETTDVVVGGLDRLKTFNGLSIGGQINSLAVINRKVYVDEAQALNLDIYGSSKTGIAIQGIGGTPIGGEPVGGYSSGAINDLVDFESIIDYSRLRYTGKKIKSIFSGGTVGERFILDFYKVKFVPKVRSLRTDKYFGV